MSERKASSEAGTSGDGDNFSGLCAAVREHVKRVTAGKSVQLFTTDAPPLFPLFLDALAPELRQHYTCSACRKFVHRFGGLVRVSAKGQATPLLWDPEGVPGPFTAAIRALASATAQAQISGVFLSAEEHWGQPLAGGWDHLAVTPPRSCICEPSALKTAGQRAAEKREDHATLLRGLEAFPVAVVKNARSLLNSEALYRSEKCLGVAQWLLDLHQTRRAARDARARDNLTWLAVAAAPPGFCHVRSTMIGTLLEDLAAGLPFADIKARFAAKMHPLQYQRPSAPPSAGNIAQAEKIVEKLRAAGSLERRFARLADIQPLWTPSGSGPRKGVFSRVRAKVSAAAQVEAPPVTMTWEKFARTVLPTAAHIEYHVPSTKQAYLGLITAKHADAPPIVQWDFEDERNPVTLYVYHGGSTPAQWNLKADTLHPVTAVTLQPTAWSTRRKFTHQGEQAIFILAGAKDTGYIKGAGFFPEFLKSEFHEIRATLEAYAREAVVAGQDEAEACGICLSKGGTWNLSFRVTAMDGMRTTYQLDRWD